MVSYAAGCRVCFTLCWWQVPPAGGVRAAHTVEVILLSDSPSSPQGKPFFPLAQSVHIFTTEPIAVGVAVAVWSSLLLSGLASGFGSGHLDLRCRFISAPTKGPGREKADPRGQDCSDPIKKSCVVQTKEMCMACVSRRLGQSTGNGYSMRTGTSSWRQRLAQGSREKGP